ncbi:Thrombospondin type-1 domain-containing protein 7A [Liparis tanakae]|uniref:Thrombospondin type-1 domain-containing protein 7A n=1 Tax=Liparis tanakae TaxID=230148 RepID=A0A4Z2F291_9TELE|nr:Thrombospondin type-1 domain-containing protein 7A [Liparis tanakae]
MAFWQRSSLLPRGSPDIHGEGFLFLHDSVERSQTSTSEDTSQDTGGVPPDLFVLPLLSPARVASRPVENQRCEGSMPSRSQLCQIPCPIACEVSPWGAWGPCTFENCEDQAGKKGGETPVIVTHL